MQNSIVWCLSFHVTFLDPIPSTLVVFGCPDNQRRSGKPHSLQTEYDLAPGTLLGPEVGAQRVVEVETETHFLRGSLDDLARVQQNRSLNDDDEDIRISYTN